MNRDANDADDCVFTHLLTPSATPVPVATQLSQLDSNIQEAVSSLLSFAQTPAVLQYPDNDGVFEPVAD